MLLCSFYFSICCSCCFLKLFISMFTYSLLRFFPLPECICYLNNLPSPQPPLPPHHGCSLILVFDNWGSVFRLCVCSGPQLGFLQGYSASLWFPGWITSCLAAVEFFLLLVCSQPHWNLLINVVGFSFLRELIFFLLGSYYPCIHR